MLTTFLHVSSEKTLKCVFLKSEKVKYVFSNTDSYFSIYKDVGRPHLRFLKVRNFNCQYGLEDQYVIVGVVLTKPQNAHFCIERRWSTGATCARDEETQKQTKNLQWQTGRPDHPRRRIEIKFCVG